MPGVDEISEHDLEQIVLNGLIAVGFGSHFRGLLSHFAWLLCPVLYQIAVSNLEINSIIHLLI